MQDKKLMAMKNVVLYIVLAKHDNEQSDLIHRIIKEKILQDLPRLVRQQLAIGIGFSISCTTVSALTCM
jgi:hypothetical protein